MKTIEISIPDMQSTHCQTRVRNAVKDIHGVQIERTEAGKLSIAIDHENLQQQVEQAITQAGYTVNAEAQTGQNSCTSSCCSI